MKLLYAIVSVGSYILRQLYLPNPFECFGDVSILLNWGAGFLLAPITFATVGLFYSSGDAPVVGSILYCVFYFINTYVLMAMSVFQFAWWWVIIILVAYVALLGFVRKLVIDQW